MNRLKALALEVELLVNRFQTTNLIGVELSRLPPPRREGRVRMLFLATTFLGFKRYHEQIQRVCAGDPEIDAVHIGLRIPFWMKILGKSIPQIPNGWDQRALRYLIMWRAMLNHWFRTTLPLDRFDVIHMMTQGMAWSLVDIKRRSTARLAVNIDATAIQGVEVLGYSRRARAPMIRREQQMFDAADLVVCRNGWCSDSLIQDYGVEPGRICIAKNSLTPPKLSRLDAPPRAATEPVRMVFVGNHFERKGGPELLRMHQQQFAERVELHVCSRRARPDRTARNVVWHGVVPNGELVGQLLPSMDLFVMPTRNDMHPWAILEAAAAGLPVVSSRLAGIPEIVIDGQTGLLPRVGDWNGFASAIERLVDSAELRRRMGAAARTHVMTCYRPDDHFGKLLARLKSLAT